MTEETLKKANEIKEKLDRLNSTKETLIKAEENIAELVVNSLDHYPFTELNINSNYNRSFGLTHDVALDVVEYIQLKNDKKIKELTKEFKKLI